MGINTVNPAQVGIRGLHFFPKPSDILMDDYLAVTEKQAQSGALSTTKKQNEQEQKPAVWPRMTVNRLNVQSSEHNKLWAGRIPANASFYDEVEQVARGHRALGVLFDSRG
jgi:hypothetical protein